MWSSSDMAVAVVNQQGLVTSRQGGETTITATAGQAKGRATAVVRIQPHAKDATTSYELQKTDLYIDPVDPVSIRTRRSFDSVQEQLGRQYTVQPVTIVGDTAPLPADIRVLAVAGSPDSLKPKEVARLRNFLARGGSMLVMANGMGLSPQGPIAFAKPVALEPVPRSRSA